MINFPNMLTRSGISQKNQTYQNWTRLFQNNPVVLNLKQERVLRALMMK